MTINAAQMVKNRQVIIHPNHKKLISQLRSARFDKRGVDKAELNFDIGDVFLMFCWDLKEFDYSSVGVTHDGKIIGEGKSRSKSVMVNTEVFE